MNRKIFLCLIFSLLVACLLWGCGGEDESPSVDNGSVISSQSQPELSQGEPIEVPEISENNTQAPESEDTSSESFVEPSTPEANDEVGAPEIDYSDDIPESSEPENTETDLPESTPEVIEPDEPLSSDGEDGYNPDEVVSNDNSEIEPDVNIPDADYSEVSPDSQEPEPDISESEPEISEIEPSEPDQSEEPEEDIYIDEEPIPNLPRPRR